MRTSMTRVLPFCCLKRLSEVNKCGSYVSCKSLHIHYILVCIESLWQVDCNSLPNATHVNRYESLRMQMDTNNNVSGTCDRTVESAQCMSCATEAGD